MLELRIKALEARTRLLEDMRVAPPHTVEMFGYEIARCAGELTWVRAARKRIAGDYYRFRGEPGATDGPSDGRWFGPLDKPGKPT